MRFSEYVNEANNIVDDWESLKRTIEKDCKPFIREIRGANSLLLKGVKQVPETYKSRSARNDNRPRISDPDLQERMNTLSKKLFGWNIREEGVLTTASYSDASRLGQPVIVFPIGSYKYVWTEDVTDLYTAFEQWETVNDVDNLKYGKSYLDHLKEVNKELWLYTIQPEMYKYHTSDLKRYLTMPELKASECIINCKKYYAINYKFNDLIVEYLGGDASKAAKRPQIAVRKTGALKKLFKNLTGEMSI
jgi:hypothetical protein